MSNSAEASQNPEDRNISRSVIQRLHTKNPYPAEGIGEDQVNRSAVDAEPSSLHSRKGTGRMILHFTSDGLETTVTSTDSTFG